MKLLPILLGVDTLLWSGRNAFGWLLTIASAISIFAGVTANLHNYFQPTSLFNTVVP